MTWILLILAGMLETVWALALKESHGLTRFAPTVLFAAAGLGSVALLVPVFRDLPVGTAYAVWTGIGAAGAALGGIVLLGEPATGGRVAPLALVVAGIVWLALAD